MSFPTFITSQINAINTTLNNLKVNAKRIFELPSQTTLDLSSKIHVSRGGVDEQLELQLLANALQSNTQNRIIGIDGNITVFGNNITVPPFQWSIDNIEYSTSTNTILNSDYCEDGLNRKDIIVANNNGLLILVTGVESSGIVIRPNIPLNSLLISELDVSDSALGTPTDPFIGISYIKKTDYQPYASNVSGDDAEIVLNTNGYSEIRLTNPLLNSIAGVDVAAALGGTEPPYNGKPFRVRNLTGNSITIKHDSVAVTNPFKLNANTDLVFPDNEIIHFIYDASGMIEDVKSFVSDPVVSSTKKTQIIEFAWLGAGYGGSSNWYRLTPFAPKYSTSFQANATITPTNNFADDSNYGFRETLMIDGKIKAITIEGDNNGVGWNCDFALRNFELSSTYNAGFTSPPASNNQIIARKQFLVGAGGGQKRTFWTPTTDFYDILLLKNSVIKPYFKTEGVANSNWQNVIMKILIEEV